LQKNAQNKEEKEEAKREAQHRKHSTPSENSYWMVHGKRLLCSASVWSAVCLLPAALHGLLTAYLLGLVCCLFEYVTRCRALGSSLMLAYVWIRGDSVVVVVVVEGTLAVELGEGHPFA
jgi:hypothetical protein